MFSRYHVAEKLNNLMGIKKLMFHLNTLNTLGPQIQMDVLGLGILLQLARVSISKIFDITKLILKFPEPISK